MQDMYLEFIMYFEFFLPCILNLSIQDSYTGNLSITVSLILKTSNKKFDMLSENNWSNLVSDFQFISRGVTDAS